MMTMRRLGLGEGGLFRQVRLEALRDSPEAFATTYESALERSEESWMAQCDSSAQGDDRATFLVLDDAPVGIAAVYRDAERPSVGELIQMWIAPTHRGGPAAAGLLDRLFEWAAGCGYTSIRAEVTPGNVRALRFYEKYGFVTVPSAGGTTCLEKAVGGVGS